MGSRSNTIGPMNKENNFSNFSGTPTDIEIRRELRACEVRYADLAQKDGSTGREPDLALSATFNQLIKLREAVGPEVEKTA